MNFHDLANDALAGGLQALLERDAAVAEPVEWAAEEGTAAVEPPSGAGA
jgi:hypothetical protein